MEYHFLVALSCLSTQFQRGWSVVKVSLSFFRHVVLLISSCQLKIIFCTVDRLTVYYVIEHTQIRIKRQEPSTLQKLL